MRQHLLRQRQHLRPLQSPFRLPLLRQSLHPQLQHLRPQRMQRLRVLR